MSEPVSPNCAEDYGQFVPFTARMMAAMRSRESIHPAPLFIDDWAARLAGEAAFQRVDQQLAPQDQAYVAVRTRFFDDFLLESLDPNLIKQIVLLAAGLDTRAYRLPWPPETHLYELDQTEVMEYKAQILVDAKPTCQHHPIAADLTQPWVDLLLGAGYDPTKPSIWLIEGLLMYLTAIQVETLLATVAQLSSSGSYLGADMVSTASLAYEPYRGYFQFGCDQPEALLAKDGWQATATQPGEPDADFDRYPWPPPPRSENTQLEATIQRVFLLKACKAGT
jgi:methyltransferase (TIGR00027 family)